MVKLPWVSAAALAIALAVPAAAQERGERFGGDVDRIEARDQARAARQEARQAQRAERAAASPAAPAGRNAPEGGWRSQRPGDGERYGRNWSNGGVVSRPDPARRAATPNIPDRGGDAMRTWRRDDGPNWAGERNRSYVDPSRNRTYRDGRRADRREDRADNRDAWRRGYHASSRDHRRWDRHDWRRDRRYDWYGYRNQHRSLFSIGRYYAPYRNYSYRRPIIGLFLDDGFYGNRYWINDPWQYRLPQVYGPYRWVRYYDDVLLVDIYTGEVVDVIHDFFW